MDDVPALDVAGQLALEVLEGVPAGPEMIDGHALAPAGDQVPAPAVDVGDFGVHDAESSG